MSDKDMSDKDIHSELCLAFRRVYQYHDPSVSAVSPAATTKNIHIDGASGCCEGSGSQLKKDIENNVFFYVVSVEDLYMIISRAGM